MTDALCEHRDGLIVVRLQETCELLKRAHCFPCGIVPAVHCLQVRIYVQVPQAFTGQLRPGLNATLELPQYPGQKFDATLVTMSGGIEQTSRSMQVELQADNSNGKLFGGSYCRVDFEIPGDPNMVRLPATALMPVNRGTQVAIVGADNKVVLKSIQLGRDFGDSVDRAFGTGWCLRRRTWQLGPVRVQRLQGGLRALQRRACER